MTRGLRRHQHARGSKNDDRAANEKTLYQIDGVKDDFHVVEVFVVIQVSPLVRTASSIGWQWNREGEVMNDLAGTANAGRAARRSTFP